MMTIDKLGWVCAAAVAGVILASGFQATTEKIANVDVNRVVRESDAGKATETSFNAMKATREGLLQFIDENRVLTTQQATELRTLWLKTPPTAADTASLERLKADVVAQARRNTELSAKPNLTPEERTLLQEYASRSAAMEQLTGQWLNEFREEFGSFVQQSQQEQLKKAKAAAQEVAKAQGYTLVFDSSVAVYASNDLTDETLKAMNAKK